MKRLLLLALLLGTACSSEDPAPQDGRVRGTLDGVRLVLEVADTPEERAVGLMRRTSVPPGTGMVFRYDAPSSGDYYMFHVPFPLTAVFALDGKVVGVIDMPPCTAAAPQACPTYGPKVPYDTVLETAPETVEGLVSGGDTLTVA